MPFEMYRHSAVFVDGKLYVIGGRTFNINESNPDESNYDELIKEINVYDPKAGDKGTWTNFMSSSDAYAPYATSDQASFAKDKSIYILGGYFSDYEVSDDVIALNIETKEIVPLDSMKKKRGDVQAAYYNQGGIEAIYMMGGFTSETSTPFCEPLFDAEKYDFATNTWSDIKPLVNQRGDKGVVVLNEKILAIGGETKHESLCSGGSVEPSSQAIVVDDVESYNPLDGDDAEWKIESDFIQFRFRSAVAVAEKLDTVYVFGGQLAYNADCKCYKTSNDIFAYREKHDHDHNSASGKQIAFALTVFVVLASTFLVV
jgi:N-acetylneuraminic acid mutarotase